MGILDKLTKKSSEEAVEVEVKKETDERKSVLPASFKPSFLVKQSWVTEKAGMLTTSNKYVFIVRKDANKSEVKKAIEGLYGVKVNDVNILKVKGKSKKLGRTLGRTSDYKKAVITLREGQKIETVTA